MGSHFFEVLPPGLPFTSRAALLWGMPYIVGTILVGELAYGLDERAAAPYFFAEASPFPGTFPFFI